MQASLLSELEAVAVLCQSARLPDDARQTVAWCLRRLPEPYHQFCQTNDIRHGEEIRRLVQGLLIALNNTTVGAAITEHLHAMHARLGIPTLRFSSPKRKKAS
jgi:hypothetical protein